MSIWSSIVGGVKGAIGGFLTGGPTGAVVGGVAGVAGGARAKPGLPALPGRGTILVQAASAVWCYPASVQSRVMPPADRRRLVPLRGHTSGAAAAVSAPEISGKPNES